MRTQRRFAHRPFVVFRNEHPDIRLLPSRQGIFVSLFVDSSTAAAIC